MKATFHQEPEHPENWFKSFTLRDLDGYYTAIYDRQDILALAARAAEARS